MSLRDSLKKLYFSLYDSNRIVLLDYAVKPLPTYSEETRSPHKQLYSAIDRNRPRYEELLLNAVQFKDRFAAIRQDKDVSAHEPGWNNGYFPGLDMVMLYSLLAQFRPSRYVEIGSGTSTKIAYKSRKENGLEFSITSIDPASRKNIKKVADKIYQDQVQAIDTTVFSSLDENDVLFFDGTHALYPNSDVMWFFLEIFPLLRKGVIVHIHDIYLPYDYPRFMLKRYYNEQYLLGALLLNNPGKYEILCPNYFIYSDKELHSLLRPVWCLPALENVEQHVGSFWFRVNF